MNNTTSHTNASSTPSILTVLTTLPPSSDCITTADIHCDDINPRPSLSTTSDIHVGKCVHLRPQPSAITDIHASNPMTSADKHCDDLNPRPSLSTVSDIHVGNQPSAIADIHACNPMTTEGLLLKHKQFVAYLESNEENNRHTLNGKHTMKPKYTDQYLLIAVSDDCIPPSIEKDLPRNCKKEARLYIMINSWICIPRTQAALAYKIGGLHSRIHGCLTMGSQEEISFHKIFDYIPISHLRLDEGPVELEDIDVSLKTGDGTSDLDLLSAELR